MSRSAGIDDTEFYRVVETCPRYRDGKLTEEKMHFVYGPYRTLGSARAARSREQRSPVSTQSTFSIERSCAAWEAVE
ncbi:hypothetical protein ACFWM7_01460 [Streptomyces sp. NPDC058375]|uniref:hypothetical protein n=1 Tax=Streptomyces sp. NPDC058375 TaxID=3346467 RepID=UPI003653BC4C